jgi:pilus assembly protein CpaE
LLDCALISSDESFRHSVLAIIRKPGNQAKLALDLPLFAGDLKRESLEKLGQAKPEIIFLDLGPDPNGTGAIQVLSQKIPGAALIVGGPTLSADGILKVMRDGATEYLPRPFEPEEISDAFGRMKRRAKAGQGVQPLTLGRLFTVFSAKGGTGVTTVSVNLAVALRLLTKKSVLLLDLAPAMGTAAITMGVQPRYTYIDVIKNFHRVDDELLHSFLETDESGVGVLASPVSPLDSERPSSEELRDLTVLCRQHFDYVVVDGGSQFSSLLAPVLDVADERLLVVTPELPALRNLKLALDQVGISNGKASPRLVLNKQKDGLGLPPRDIEDGLGHRMDLVVGRYDSRIIESVNMGRPEVLSGNSRFAKEIMALGRKLAGPGARPEPKKGLLGRILPGSKSARSRHSEEDK